MNLNYLLQSTKKHPYSLVSKNLGSIYICHKSYSGMYTKMAKAHDEIIGFCSKPVVSPFLAYRIQVTGSG